MSAFVPPPISTVPGFLWPAQPNPAAQAMLATLFQLDLSQWWAGEAVLDRQLRQLRQLVAHAVAHCPHYANHLAEAGVGSVADLTLENFRNWPLLSKRTVQAAGASFVADSVPPAHGEHRWVTTSGSTGQPLRAATTEVAVFFQHALVLRSFLWYGLDFGAKFASIKASTKQATYPDWGIPVSAVFRTGSSVTFSAFQDHAEQVDWIRREAPAYLLAHNTNLRALLEKSRRAAVVPAGLLAILGFGDTAAPDTRELAREIWDCVFYDTYSCNEIGTLALECPSHRQMHVQSERVVLEVLREDDTPCGPGETGRVVVTDLHNFAMPLIRYELNDHATVGEACPCGRGLPLLTRIVGRTSDLAVDPTGRRYFAHLGQGYWVTASPILQRQIVQHTAALIEVRYVAERELNQGEKSTLTAELQAAMAYPYEIRFTRVDSIPLGAGGKFVDFKSLMDGQQNAPV